jgi:hypothetical protein
VIEHMFDSSSDHAIVIPGRAIQRTNFLYFIFSHLEEVPVQLNENSIPIIMNDNSSTSIQLLNPQSGRAKRRHFIALILIFLLSILSLCVIYILFPKIDSYGN